MHSPAAAIAWEFRRRHRWGLYALIAYLFILAVVKLVILWSGQRVELTDEKFGLIVMGPLCATLIYLLSVFSFGLSGDLGARQSIYPARMFTMPVSASALAGLPMLYGIAAIVMLWFGMRAFTLWPSDVDVPVIWPALMAASLLAWTQALTWMSYPLPGLRVMVMVLWLAAIDAMVMIALNLKVRETVMLAILAPHVPLAYLAARSAVARARRGEVPHWRLRLFGRRGRIADFSSRERAQTWFEWRLHGRSLPWLVAIVLPFELALLFAFSRTPELVFETLLFVLFTPPFLAAFVAATVSKANTAFIATRPMTGVSLIAAKMKATVLSTLASWLLVLIAVPLALRFSGAAPVVMERAHRLIEVCGMPRAIVIALLAFGALMAATWKWLVQSLFIGMSGREWIVKGSAIAALSFLAVIAPLAVWISGSRYAMAVLWKALPSIMAVLACCKLSAAVWIAIQLHDKRLLAGRTLILGAVCWDVIVFALYGLLAWFFPLMLPGNDFLALVAILEVPLVRIAAAPLVLAWSRHR